MKITIIGSGNIGRAIARGLVRGGVFNASDITCTDLMQANLDRLLSADACFNVSQDNPMGMAMSIKEELMMAGTVLASSGIAFALRYIRAASEGGVELGFYPDQAKEIVLKTVKGAVDLLLTHGSNPETEIDKVTTPGGITIRGLNKMEEEGFTSAVIKGLKASK